MTIAGLQCALTVQPASKVVNIGNNPGRFIHDHDSAPPRPAAPPENAMQVKRIVANIPALDIAAARRFYHEALGLEVLMDHGWLATYGTDRQATVQLSVATQGGSDTPVPDLSIEVDDLDEALRRLRAGGFPIEYGPADEPWGVRRFYVRDPFGKLVNILAHR